MQSRLHATRYPTAELWNEASGCYRKVAVVITIPGTQESDEHRLNRLLGARARLAGVPLYRNPHAVGKVLGSPEKRWRKLARMECWAEGWERPDLYGDGAPRVTTNPQAVPPDRGVNG